jgi:N-acetylglucosaminyl-diphospho-decaprenol L-rhamnosyltransferase
VPLSELVSLIIVSRNRKDELEDTLVRCTAGQDPPRIIVVDNASSDGTAEEVSSRFPAVRLIGLHRNEGAAARNHGVKAAQTPFVALNDDDSYFAPGCLEVAVSHLQRLGDVGGIAGKVLVGENEEVDPTCEAMAHSPLGKRAGEPGPEILGFLACAFVARREALLQVGGFDASLSGVGGEEGLLALDLAAAGWRLIYAPEVVVHHHPSSLRSGSERRRAVARNELFIAWMRRRPLGAIRRTEQIVAHSWKDRAARQGVIEAFRSAPKALSRRRPVPLPVERSLKRLENWSGR